MHVIINGVSSETLQGVQVLSLPPITKPRMRTSVAVIDGRPGDIVTRLGYEAYNRKIEVLLHHDYDIDAISAFFNTSGKIIFSNEPDMEYEFETIDAFSFERAVRYKTADITFHVQPYKLGATEEPATGEVSTLADKTPYIIRRTPFGTRQKGTIVGGSIVWNQFCNNASVTVANDHKYLLEKDDAYSIGASTGTALTGLTAGSDMVFDLTLMFGPTIADYIYTQEQATAGTGVALAKAWAGIIANYYPYDAGSIKSVTGVTSHKMTGKNQFSTDNISAKTIYRANILPIDSNSFYLTGANRNQDTYQLAVNSWANIKVWFGMRAQEDTTVTVSCKVKNYTADCNGYIRVGYADTEGGAVTSTASGGQNFNTIGETNIQFSVTVPKGKYAVLVATPVSKSSAVTLTQYTEVEDFQIEYGSTATSYEPYTTRTYSLDSSLTLRGLPKLDGDNLYYDGDIYKADGTVERRYGFVDLGTLVWTLVSDRYWRANFRSAYNKGNAIPANAMAEKYVINSANRAHNTAGAIGVASGGDAGVSSYVYCNNGSTTETPTGMFLYELDEPTTEQAEPYTALQICDPAGTEEFVGALMPVGHDTTYIDPISMTVNNEGNTTSAPSITIEGEGTVEVTVDGLNILQIQMPASGEITIDSKTLDATDGVGGLANRSVTGDYNDLRLAPGEHTVTVTGDVTSVTLKNISRWI